MGRRFRLVKVTFRSCTGKVSRQRIGLFETPRCTRREQSASLSPPRQDLSKHDTMAARDDEGGHAPGTPPNNLTADEAEALAQQFQAVWDQPTPAAKPPAPKAPAQTAPAPLAPVSNPPPPRPLPSNPAAPPTPLSSSPPPRIGSSSAPPAQGDSEEPAPITPRGLGPKPSPYRHKQTLVGVSPYAPTPSDPAPPARKHETLLGIAPLPAAAPAAPTAPQPVPTRPSRPPPQSRELSARSAGAATAPQAPQVPMPSSTAAAPAPALVVPPARPLADAAPPPVEERFEEAPVSRPQVYITQPSPARASHPPEEPSVIVESETTVPIPVGRRRGERNVITAPSMPAVRLSAPGAAPAPAVAPSPSFSSPDLEVPQFHKSSRRTLYLLAGGGALALVVGLVFVLGRSSETTPVSSSATPTERATGRSDSLPVVPPPPPTEAVSTHEPAPPEPPAASEPESETDTTSKPHKSAPTRMAAPTRAAPAPTRAAPTPKRTTPQRAGGGAIVRETPF